ncbi:MAG TPA: hypothetical protein VIY48_14515, partial [Candidatus Paceibacterota bacterium]
DPVWFQKAKAALRYRGIEHQKFLRERAKMVREKKQQEANTWERRFIDAVRTSVSPALYQELVRMASQDSATKAE